MYWTAFCTSESVLALIAIRAHVNYGHCHNLQMLFLWLLGAMLSTICTVSAGKYRYFCYISCCSIFKNQKSSFFNMHSFLRFLKRFSSNKWCTYSTHSLFANIDINLHSVKLLKLLWPWCQDKTETNEPSYIYKCKCLVVVKNKEVTHHLNGNLLLCLDDIIIILKYTTLSDIFLHAERREEQCFESCRCCIIVELIYETLGFQNTCLNYIDGHREARCYELVAVF